MRTRAARRALSAPLLGYLKFFVCQLATVVIFWTAHDAECRAGPIKEEAEIRDVLVSEYVPISDLKHEPNVVGCGTPSCWIANRLWCGLFHPANDNYLLKIGMRRREGNLIWDDWRIDASGINFQDDGGRVAVVVENVFSKRRSAHKLRTECPTDQAMDDGIGFDRYIDIRGVGLLKGPFSDVSGLFGGRRRLPSDGNRGFHVSGLFSSGFDESIGRVEQANSESSKNRIEEYKQPISDVLPKFVIPLGFLLSFLVILLAAKIGGRAAGVLVGLIGYGWLLAFVWYGLLQSPHETSTKCEAQHRCKERPDKSQWHVCLTRGQICSSV